MGPREITEATMVPRETTEATMVPRETTEATMVSRETTEATMVITAVSQVPALQRTRVRQQTFQRRQPTLLPPWTTLPVLW